MEQRDMAAGRFGAAAANYLTSDVHATGADLTRLEELARTADDGSPALDLGCGAGHAAYALARGGAKVTACDIAPEMLAVVAAEAERRGLDITTRQTPAERLPFPDGAFALAATRYSAHHWADVPAALAELRRVLAPDAPLAVVDIVAPESPLCDTVLQAAEILRDPSHVRDYRVSEWLAMLTGAGFAEPETTTWRVPARFAAWTARMRTPERRAEAARDVLVAAPEEARGHFDVEADGSFLMDAAMLMCRRA